jgi:hypothetical protein
MKSHSKSEDERQRQRMASERHLAGQAAHRAKIPKARAVASSERFLRGRRVTAPEDK